MLQVFEKYLILISLITIQWVCSETSPAESKKCLIPDTPQLQNIIFKLHPQNQTIKQGSYVDDYEIVNMECERKTTLRGPSSLICQNGEWNSDFPKCDDTHCDGALLRRLSIRPICDNGLRFFDCPEKILPGTTIQIHCSFGYTRKPQTTQVVKCLPNGVFDKVPERCEQQCGQSAPFSVALSKDGLEIESSLTRWHVFVYEKDGDAYNYRCGGTIISPTIIISTANCFWDEANLILKNYTKFQIIAGRNTRDYTTEQSLYSQLVNVKEINIPAEYQGKEQQLKDDIAFLRLERPLKYSETVLPICLPKDLRISASAYVLSNKKGLINVYGPQKQLETLRMVTLAYHDCVERSPKDAPLADDKFCIYNTEGGSVCRGDSGAGFFTAITDFETNETKYKLSGVISHTPVVRNDCTVTGNMSYIAVTNIFSMPSEFKRKLANARKEDEALF